ncbi:hypothetical protein [Dapis sp. BLCC M229]|uniref:hypothetical protein n=1 Tax=Dapis sp. BLCC M229 TaxID=3400188 RepID=UPI003CF16EF2
MSQYQINLWIKFSKEQAIALIISMTISSGKKKTLVQQLIINNYLSLKRRGLMR